MSFLDQLRKMLDDPPPACGFEVSPAGIAWAIRASKRGQAPQFDFRPLEEGTIEASPVKDNVTRPEAFAAEVAALAPPNGNKKRRHAALILPDYCARIAVLDFDSFPATLEDQLALVRFRLKKAVPFDLDSAALSVQAHKVHGKTEVVAAAASMEIVARYEAPFRAAHFATGFATTSTLAAMDLMPADGMNVLAKLSGRQLTVAVCNGRQPKLVRCVEMGSMAIEEVMAVLFPTFAYAEDELKQRPRKILACGFGRGIDALSAAGESELGAGVEPLRSRWGPAGEYNCGLLGWLQAQEEGR